MLRQAPAEVTTYISDWFHIHIEVVQTIGTAHLSEPARRSGRDRLLVELAKKISQLH
ncbi:MAG: hypothetical protein AAFX40_15335 [Cyanobacteria bacterium J06639_1]